MPQVPILYHGTDARFVRLTKQDRFVYKDACFAVIDYLWSFYEPYDFGGSLGPELQSLLNYDQNPDQWKTITTALRFIRGMKSGHSQYQYQQDSIYLTCFKDFAIGFAKNAFAGGELGRVALVLLDAVPLMRFHDWNPQGQVLEAIKQIKTFSSESPEPVVFKFENLDLTAMFTDTNQSIQLCENELINQTQFRVVRYTKPIVLNLQDACWVGKT